MKERPILFSAPMVRALLAGTKTQTRRVIKPRHLAFFNQDAAAMLSDWNERPLPYGKTGDRLWVRETWQFHGGMLDCGTGRSSAGTSLYQDIVVSYPADGARVTLHPNGQDWPTPNQPPQRGGEVYSLRDAPADFVYTGKNTYHDRLTRWWNRKIPGIHMPRWASRITLEITSVRVERLQDISEADAAAEGLTFSAKARRSDGCMGIYELRMPDGKLHFNDNACDLFRTLWEQINGPGSWDANPWVWAIEFRRLA